MKGPGRIAKPKVRLHGSTDKASGLIGAANALLQKVHQIAELSGASVYALWAKRPDGAAIRAAKYGSNINILDCYAADAVDNPGEDESLREKSIVLESRLFWVPQGIVLTPRNRNTAPDGWGIPDQTPGGALPQVLINHYPHNNYPDVIFRLLHPPAGFKKTTATEVIKAVMAWKSAPGLFMDYERDLAIMDQPDPEGPNWLPASGGEQPVGIYDPRVQPNDDDLWPDAWTVYIDPHWHPAHMERASVSEYRTLPLITEARSPEWFIHRPQPCELMRSEEVAEMDADELSAMMADLNRYVVINDVIADVMTGINAIRAGYGRDPINEMPLRGDYSVVSDMIATENIGLGQVPLPHDSPAFRDGYRSFVERAQRALRTRGAENLGALVEEEGVPSGQRMVELWEASPPHLGNIVTSWPTSDDPHQSYASAAVTQASGYFSDGESGAGMLYLAQTFDRKDEWLIPKIAHHSGPYGVIGWSSEGTTNRYHCSIAPLVGSPDGKYRSPSLILMTGRIPLPRYIGTDALILGAALVGFFPDSNGVPFESVRVAVLSANGEAFGDGHPLVLRIETWALQDLPRSDAAPLHETEIPLPANTRVTRFNFSPDGTKGAATVFSPLAPYTGRKMSIYRTILDDTESDDVDVNPGTSVQIVRYSNGSMILSDTETLLVTPSTETTDRARTGQDTGVYPPGDTIRYNRYRAVCQGEHTLYVDYDDTGAETIATLSVDIETDLGGSFALDSDTDQEPLVSTLNTGRYSEDGEYGYNFVIQRNPYTTDEIAIPDSRGYPAPGDATYIHREHIELKVNGQALLLTDYENFDHWGVGTGVTRTLAHLDIRNLNDTLAHVATFNNGECREVWEHGGVEIGDVIANSYAGTDNFLGVPRFLPPFVAGGIIRQGIGRVFVVPGDDQFQPPYPEDLLNEKYLSDFRVAVNFTPIGTSGREMGIPASPFYAVLSPDVNEGLSYGAIAGDGGNDHRYECSWRTGPRFIQALESPEPAYEISNPVELWRIGMAREYRGQVLRYEGERIAAMRCAALLGCPYNTRHHPNYWTATIQGLAERMGVDEYDDVGDIGIV